jgi:DNA-binding NtrC family response regulator
MIRTASDLGEAGIGHTGIRSAKDTTRRPGSSARPPDGATRAPARLRYTAPGMEGSRILIIDDDPTIRTQLRHLFEVDRCEVLDASSLAAARAAALDFRPEVVLLDYELPDGTALDLLPFLKESAPDVPILVLTGHREIDVAVATIKAGAEQFLTKPIELAALRTMVRRLIEQRLFVRRDRAGEVRRARYEPEPFLGESAAIRELERQARTVAGAESPVLLQGETGTGKGLLARWLHAHSRRAQQAFVDLNCAGLSRELLDSELFGHAKGAFTGALAAKPGLFETADRGSFFLDEIGDTEITLQPKILKVVEEKRFRRLGEVAERRVDVRMIAASNVDLGQAVAEKRFRADLYYRLNTLTLRLTPLRDRPEDIPVLASSILERLGVETGKRLELGDDAIDRLCRYEWPGNIRELHNVLERALLLARTTRIDATHLTLESRLPAIAEPPAGGDLFQGSLEEVERRYIERILRLENGQVDRAADRLSVPRSTLYQRLKSWGLQPSAFRGDREVAAAEAS